MTSSWFIKLKDNKIISGFSQTQQYILLYFIFSRRNVSFYWPSSATCTKHRI